MRLLLSGKTAPVTITWFILITYPRHTDQHVLYLHYEPDARGAAESRRLRFFQAEAGIRDATVPGVQTCALPILSAARSAPRSPRSRPPPGRARAASHRTCRSEERRVGEECRSPRSPYHSHK